jgi:uncharacterized membrane protein/predicted double-glycine peptidase
MTLFNSYSSADAPILTLLKYLSVNIHPDKIVEEMEKHPDNPSLLAISDVLSNFNIDNLAFKAEIDELSQVPCPFIAHTKTDDGDSIVVVNRLEKNHIYFSTEKWNKKRLTIEEFNIIFTGTVLAVEPPSKSDTASSITFNSIINSIKNPAIGIVLIFMLLMAVYYHTGYFSYLSIKLLLITLLKSAGLVTSCLLLLQSLDKNNPVLQKFCNINGKTNCNAILSSKAAIVFNGLTWSDIGFGYFAGTWLLILFGGNSPLMLQILLFLNIVSLPYTFYSIYYQAIIAKQWCVFCCTIQAILWLEFIPLMSQTPLPYQGEGVHLREITTVFICLFLPFVLWGLLKQMLLKLMQIKPLKNQLTGFKYNLELFNKILNDQPRYPLPDEEWAIILGNTEADNIITMVTNPFCSPCAETHRFLDDLLDKRESIQIRIVFAAENADTDQRTLVSRHLMALNLSSDKRIVKNALNAWYEQKHKSYDSWARHYPVELIEADFYKLDKQRNWCKMADVTVTPTILLNGYRLPDQYQLKDLKYMLD